MWLLVCILMQKDYSIQNSKFIVVLKFLYHAFSPSSWWSHCISPGGPMLVLGWSSRWSWLPKQRDNTEPRNSSSCYWSLWLLLLWTCRLSKHLHINGETKPIPRSPLDLVKANMWRNYYKILFPLIRLNIYVSEETKMKHLLTRDSNVSTDRCLHTLKHVKILGSILKQSLILTPIVNVP